MEAGRVMKERDAGRKVLLDREEWLKSQRPRYAQVDLQADWQRIGKIWHLLRENPYLLRAMTVGYQPERNKEWLKDFRRWDGDGYRCIVRQSLRYNRNLCAALDGKSFGIVLQLCLRV